MKKCYYFYLGTVAELIKISPVIHELNKRKQYIKIVTTGQNSINFQEFEDFTGPLKKFIKVGEKPQKSSVILFFFWTIRTLFKSYLVLNKDIRNEYKKNCILIVHGDTVTSFIGAVVGKMLKLKLVHVESGLRSYNFFEPFPEEICRYIVSKLADIHFCPNEWSVRNLKKESGLKINTFYNTVIETCLKAVKLGKKTTAVFPVHKYFILVFHRQEHVIYGKEQSKKILEHVLKVAPKNLDCVFIIHDLTADFLRSINIASEKVGRKIIFLPRLAYQDFMKLLDNSELIITDGGSNQEEAFFLGIPCLILRNVTERIEGLDSNALLSKNNLNQISLFLKNYQKYKSKRVIPNKEPSKIVADVLMTSYE